MKIMKKHQELPSWMADELINSSRSNRDALIYQLVQIGWTLTSVGDAISMSRERVRQIHNQVATSLSPHASLSHAHLPQPPIWPDKPAKTLVLPSSRTLDRLLALMPKAQLVRGKSKRYRREAEEFTALLNHAHKIEGVSLYRLAKTLGVTHAAIRFRLCRYGYLQAGSGKSGVYTPISIQNRFG